MQPEEVRLGDFVRDLRFSASLSPASMKKTSRTRTSFGPSPLAQVDAHLERTAPRCIASALKGCLPTWAKAHYPFTVPSEWVPSALQPRAAEVLTLEVDLDLEVAFHTCGVVGEIDANPAAGHQNGTATRACTLEPQAAASLQLSSRGISGANRAPLARWGWQPPIPPTAQVCTQPIYFELQLSADGVWPSCALTLSTVHVRTRCMIWWDALQGAGSQLALLAFCGPVPGPEATPSPEVEWEAAMRMHGCCSCALSSPAIQDALAKSLAMALMRSHNQCNPLTVDLEPLVQATWEEAAVLTIQAAARGQRVRSKWAVRDRQVTQLKAQIRELQDSIAAAAISRHHCAPDGCGERKVHIAAAHHAHLEPAAGCAVELSRPCDAPGRMSTEPVEKCGAELPKQPDAPSRSRVKEIAAWHAARAAQTSA